MNSSTISGSSRQPFMSAAQVSKMRSMVKDQWAEIWQVVHGRQQREIQERRAMVQQALRRKPC